MPYNQFGMGQQGMRPQGFGQFPQPQMGTGGFNPWQLPQQPQQPPQYPGYGGVPATNPFAGGPFDPSLWDPSGSYAGMPVGYENGVPGYYQHMQVGSKFIPITGGNVPWKPGEYQTDPNPQKWDPNLPGGGFPPIGLPPLPPGQQPPGQPPIGLPPLPPGYQPPGGFVGGDWVYDPRTQNIPPDATELPPWMYPPGYQPPGQPPIGLPPLPPPGYQGDNVSMQVPFGSLIGQMGGGGTMGQPTGNLAQQGMQFGQLGGGTGTPMQTQPVQRPMQMGQVGGGFNQLPMQPVTQPIQQVSPLQQMGNPFGQGGGMSKSSATSQKRIPKGSMYGGMERL